MAVIFFNRSIPDECHQKMGEFAAAGNDVTWVAFAPGGGSGFSILTKNGQFFNRNIPNECHEKMKELSKDGAKVVRVAFPPQGGNSWSIVNDRGAFLNRNIPDECHQKMKELSKDGARIVSVAFPPQGGNSWSIVNDRGAFLNRNIPDEAHMYMGFFSAVYGPVRIVSFDVDGNGWSVASAVTKAEKVCDATKCVSTADVYHNIAERLNDKVVGYACSVGSAWVGAFSHGYARTNANAPARLFLPSTKIPVASVSKVVTALAAIRVLAKRNVSLDSAIGAYVPSDWKLDPYVASMTFRQLLSHRSGIKDYGNNDQTYDTLKKFFTQKVDPTKNTPCQPASVNNPANPINPNDQTPCYSNYNFGIFRVLLPMIDGFADDPANRAAKLAAAYIKIVEKNVFEPVGAYGVDAKPPATGPQASAYAFSYKYPGSEDGHDWGDSTAGVGAAGWYLAIEDIDKVLYSLNKNDGRILTKAQMTDMETTPLGWDVTKDSGYRWVEKNGGWGANGTTLSTSIALFGPGVFGALFINSDKAGRGRQNNWERCVKCKTLAFAGSTSPGNCPAGGMHSYSGSKNYLVATTSSGIVGQGNWRWCKKCQALSFAGGSSLGTCSAGGQHDHSGSANYVVAQRTGGALPDYSEDNWRWCKNCQVLAFAGGALGTCAVGGTHNHTGSGDYVLENVVGADVVLRDSFMKALKPKTS
jgi:CubicO group peptidase (beta-lactamase class C family)